MTYPPFTLMSREVPYPSSISDIAREQLATTTAMSIGGMPHPESIAEWDAMTTVINDTLFAMIPAPGDGTSVTPMELGGLPAFEIRPTVPPVGRADRICLYFHGGGLTIGSGRTGGAMAAAFAQGAQLHTIGLDYRMPPRFPYPVPLDDCLAAYQALLETWSPADIVVAGTSAGGNLASALVLRARDEGLPLPSAVVLLSPQVDLTESGDSFETVMGLDPVLRSRLTEVIALYAAGNNLSHPYLSPLFGDFSEGFPPTFLQCGTRDSFLSNTVRFHRALSRERVPVALHVFEAMPHGGFGSLLEGGLGSAPEDQEVYEEVRRFIAALA